VTPRRTVLVYLTAVAIGFAVIYGLLGFREFSLYLALGALNLPASLIALPLSERVAEALGVTIGSASHVWGAQVASMALNGALIAGAITVCRHLRRPDGKGEHAV
jgi:hypothetical protein